MKLHAIHTDRNGNRKIVRFNPTTNRVWMVNQHNISLTLANVMVLRTDLNGQRAQSETLRGAIQIGNPESCRALCAILKTETGLHWSF